MQTDGFIYTSYSGSNLDTYYIRQAILKAIDENLQRFNGRLLDIGCGKMPYRQRILEKSSITAYTGLDIATALEYDATVKPDYTWDGIMMPFEDGLFDTAFGTEVLEHCPQPGIILRETARVLKRGGLFFFTVPFLWPLHEVPHDEFRYTPFSLTRLLEEAGFENISIKATGGWHASMAQMLGLWTRRAPLTNRSRKWFSLLLKPVIRYLIKKDKNITPVFKEGQMITGLYGIAYKK